MRRLIRLVEAAGSTPTVECYLHVTSLSNKASVLAKGLLANHAQGNYAGYWQSLDGVYVTNDPAIIHNHVSARNMVGGYLLVVVEMPAGHGVIDEDVLHMCLRTATDAVLKKHGMSVGEIEDYDAGADDPMWSEVTRRLAPMFGTPDRAALARHSGILDEFVREWITEHVYETEVDQLWWADAKEALVSCYPAMVAPGCEHRHSLRLPGPIGYSGSPRIAAVIGVRDGVEKVLKGKVPAQARALVEVVVGNTSDVPDPGNNPTMSLEDMRKALLPLALKRHPDRSEAEIVARIEDLDYPTTARLLLDYKD